MPIRVTAFGPFGGRAHNASLLVLLELRKAVPGIRTRILPVDTVLAPSRLMQGILRIRPGALTTPFPPPSGPARRLAQGGPPKANS